MRLGSAANETSNDRGDRPYRLDASTSRRRPSRTPGPRRLGLAIAGSAAALIALAASAPGAAQVTRNFRVEAKSATSVGLDLCSSVVDVAVKGDGDTDLDFVIRDEAGRVVHTDADRTDMTFATLRPSGSGCVRYALAVTNIGPIFNRFTVKTTDRGTALAASGGDGKNRRVAIHNHTAEAFAHLYFSNTADGKWGVDRLGSGVQRAGSNRTFDITDGTGACRFDIMVQTASGQKYTKSNVNVCAVSSVEFGTEISH